MTKDSLSRSVSAEIPYATGRRIWAPSWVVTLSTKMLAGPRLRYALLSGLILVLWFARRPEMITNPQFWAEDGAFVFRDQLLYGFHALTMPLAGYVLPIARLGSAFASLFPLSGAPAIYSWFSCIMGACCCALFSLPHFRPLLPSNLQRAGLCLVVALGSHARELIGSLINVQWWILLVGVLLIACPPKTPANGRLQAILWCIAGAAIGFTAPTLVIAAPFLLWHVFKSNSRPTRLLSLAMLLGVSVQVILAFFVFSGITPQRATIDQTLLALLVDIAYRVVLESTLGSHVVKTVLTAKLAGTALASLVAVVIWLSWLVVVSGRKQRIVILLSIYLSLSSLMLALVGRGLTQQVSSLTVLGLGGPRYFFLSASIFAYLVAVTTSQCAPGRWRAVGFLALVAVFMVAMCDDFVIPPLLDFHWKAETRQLRDWRRAKRRGEAAPAVSVAINPPGWSIDLPALGRR